MSEFIQVGQTALRDPITGKFLPAVPLFVPAPKTPDEEAAIASAAETITELAAMFKQYMDGCEAQGLAI